MVEEKRSFGSSIQWLGSDVTIGALIAFLSILTTLAGYQGSVVSGAASDYNLQGMQTLTDANAEYLTANQNVIEDYTSYDNYYINQNNADLADYFKANFSDSLTASLKRPNGPFDDQYYTDMYADAGQLSNKADKFFEQANQAGNSSGAFTQVTLMMAIGLSLAGWGSLIKEESKLRVIFSFVALLILILGGSIFLKALPPGGVKALLTVFIK